MPGKLSAQVITFVSAPEETIHVSDTRLESGKQTNSDYTFVPNFGRKTLNSAAYILNTNDEVVDNRGNSYKKVESGAVTVPFRPYFVATSNGAPKMTRSIIFSYEQTQLEGNDDDLSGKLGESVDIRCGKRSVVVTSNLRTTTDVRIFNVGGLCVATFDIEPGQTIEHPIYHDGVYVVHVAGGRYRSKLAVK